MSLINELKRRNVLRAGAAYVVVAWLILQVADVILNNIEAPGRVLHVILLLALGYFAHDKFVASALHGHPRWLELVDRMGLPHNY